MAQGRQSRPCAIQVGATLRAAPLPRRGLTPLLGTSDNATVLRRFRGHKAQGRTVERARAVIENALFEEFDRKYNK